MRLAPAVGVLARAIDDLPRALDRLAGAGFSAVQLDATLPAIRPRSLDRQARRDLAAFCRRRDLEIAGIDIFIPVRHLGDESRVDAAMAAVLGAIELAADLGSVPVSFDLPDRMQAGDHPQTAAILAQADRCGTPLAIGTAAKLDRLLEWVGPVAETGVGIGYSPAPALLAGKNPADDLGKLGKALRVGRLCDLGSSGARAGIRCPIGAGDLDLEAYRVGLDIAASRLGPVVLDLDGLTDPWAVLASSLQTWEESRPAL